MSVPEGACEYVFKYHLLLKRESHGKVAAWLASQSGTLYLVCAFRLTHQVV